MTSTVYIAKNVYGGDGLGRLGDGRVVFVGGAWAGEQVKAEIVSEKRHFVRARLVEVVEPSPERCAASADAVPGMVYDTLSYAGEIAAKGAQLTEALSRARLDVASIEGPDGRAEEPFSHNYRNKAVYHFDCVRGAWRIGYRTEPSHEIVDVDHDPLVVKPINDALGEIRRSVMQLLTTGPEAVRRDIARKGRVTVRWTERSGVKWWVGDAPKGLVLKEATCGREFLVPADGFYQVNPRVANALVGAVSSAYAAGVQTAPDILDLYCGVGVFGLCARAAHPIAGAHLTGIESGRQAIDFARQNAAAHGIEGRFFAEEVERNLKRIRIGADTTVIVDPPRDGMAPNVPSWLAASRAPRILYVSCDPATLVRDLKVLSGAYAVESVRWFDMFPRTARFETFVTLVRR